MIVAIDKYVPFERVSDNDLIKARLFNKCRLSDTGCWLWLGPTNRGYGIFYVGNKGRYSHRISYEAFVGPVPKGLHLLHSCDTPGCINPAHLRPGTVKENMADREARRRRSVQGEQIGTSKLTYQEVLEIRSSKEKPGPLAKKYNVHPHCIWSIKTGRSWKHVADAENAKVDTPTKKWDKAKQLPGVVVREKIL